MGMREPYANNKQSKLATPDGDGVRAETNINAYAIPGLPRVTRWTARVAPREAPPAGRSESGTSVLCVGGARETA